MKTVTAKEVKSILDKDPKLKVVNVLPKEQFEKKHIPQSVNVPLTDSRFLQRVEEVAGAKSEPIVVYCASESCDASPKAAKRLEEAGFRDVRDLEGGVDEWQREGFRLAGTATA
jgi:rhodanese-related sulfurtransferase